MKPFTKRVLIVVLVMMFAFTLSVTAAGGKEEMGEVSSGGRTILDYNTITTRPSEGIERPTPYEKYLLDKFGIRLNYEEIAADSIEKLNLLFATGEGPEVLLFDVAEPEIKRWGIEGQLVPLSDYFDRLPNYRKLWTDSAWDFMIASASSSDGKLYYLPPTSGLCTGYAYIWRKGTFDKMGLEFPKTTDELYSTLKKIKQAHPEAFPYSNRWGVDWLMQGFMLPFRTATRWLIDPDTGKLVYGPVTDKAREALKYANKLYKEGLIEPEFPTSTTQTWTERFAKGLTYFQSSYAGRAAWANDTMKDTDPEAGWAVSHEMLVSDPGKEQLHSRYGYGAYDVMGPCINSQLSQEKIDRLIEYFDWAATEEGRIFHSFGVEGETFRFVNGKPVYMDNIFSLKNPEGIDMKYFGFLPKEMGGLLVAGDLESSAQKHGSAYTDLAAAVENRPYIKDQIAWKLSKDQEAELVDLDTVIQDIWEEFATKFVLGKLDPGNDADWNEYLTAMNKSGLAKEIEIRGGIIGQSKVY